MPYFFAVRRNGKNRGDGINIDALVDIGFAEEKVGNKVCIMGIVAPVKVMLNGFPENVKKASEECIEKAGGR